MSTKIKLKRDRTGRLIFTKKMKKNYTVLLPGMLPIHFKLLKNIFTEFGYNAVLLNSNSPEIAQTGLKYVHNDTCYPALLVIGQFINALQSGMYDVNKTALMITQTGGGCRASNYIHLLRKALQKAGFGNVPVISLNMSGLEKNSGFKLKLSMMREMISALVYGDALMMLKNQVEPYEQVKGTTDNLVDKWINDISRAFYSKKGVKLLEIRKNIDKMAHDFSMIRINKTKKIKVGIVGEIYIKYSSLGNNDLEKFLKSQNCEVCVPGLLNFLLFKTDNRLEDIKLYGGSRIKYALVKTFMSYMLKAEKIILDAVSKYKCFYTPASYMHKKELVKGIIGYGNKMGEGWLLTAEMLELSESGFENIICAQPFGCLPNHICGKGMIRKIREVAPNSNIVAIDYDPGASKVNQENRIKLMLAIAAEKNKDI